MFPVLSLFLLLMLPLQAGAAVEIALGDAPATVVEEVYLHEGVPYLPAEEVLAGLGLEGRWDSVAHVYRIRTPRGTAVISPGSRYLRLGERFIPLAHSPRFIDGRLRISEDIVAAKLPALLGLPVRYRNLDPPVAAAAGDETPLDKLFSFLLRKKTEKGAALRGIALDPGHGGQDAGSLGIDGVKEKDVTLGVANRLEKLMKMQMGIPVYLSRDGDYGLETRQRLEIAARPDVDALIVLHAQSSFRPQARGVTFYVRPQEILVGEEPPAGEGESVRLAQLLAAACRDAGFSVAGIVKAPLLPLGRGNLPTVMTELGYLSNPQDQAILSDPEGQQRLATALFSGLKRFADERKEARK